jgi:hypothetical protein
MNQGAGRRVLMKKTACKKSHATVPLRAQEYLESSKKSSKVVIQILILYILIYNLSTLPSWL